MIKALKPLTPVLKHDSLPSCTALNNACRRITF